jgi:hypothetical protein
VKYRNCPVNCLGRLTVNSTNISKDSEANGRDFNLVTSGPEGGAPNTQRNFYNNVKLLTPCSDVLLKKLTSLCS